MSQHNSSDTISINVEPFLMPLALIISTIIFSISFIIGMNVLAGGSFSLGSRTGSAQNNDPENTVSGGSIEELVENIGGIDTNAFASCYENRETEDEVEGDLADGQADGVSGTPGFVVGRVNGNAVENGYRVSGALPADVFDKLVESLEKNDTSIADEVIAQYSDYIFKDASTSLDNDPIKGDSNAPIAIVEFSDLECPFCQRHHNEQYPTIVENIVDTGRALYVFRDFPLSFHNPVATDAAVAAQCVYNVAGADAYYNFLDSYFKNTKSNGQGL